MCEFPPASDKTYCGAVTHCIDAQTANMLLSPNCSFDTKQRIKNESDNLDNLNEENPHE